MNFDCRSADRASCTEMQQLLKRLPSVRVCSKSFDVKFPS